MISYSAKLKGKYMPYAIFDENGNIIGFEENTPKHAKEAAKEHILMRQKYDDISNFEYWDNLIIKLKL